MKIRWVRFAMPAMILAALSATLVARAQWPVDDDTDGSDIVDDESVHNLRSAARAVLRARLERQRSESDAATQVQASALQQDVRESESASGEIDELTIDENCASGTIAWRRANDLVICASLCASDLDCAFPDRCRLLASMPSADEPVVLADDREEIEIAPEDVATVEQEMGLCDPFWDLEGSVDSLDEQFDE